VRGRERRTPVAPVRDPAPRMSSDAPRDPPDAVRSGSERRSGSVNRSAAAGPTQFAAPARWRATSAAGRLTGAGSGLLDRATVLGRGLATEALAELVGIVDARPLHAEVVNTNVASIRVLEKCGFTQVDGHVGDDGSRSSSWSYADPSSRGLRATLRRAERYRLLDLPTAGQTDPGPHRGHTRAAPSDQYGGDDSHGYAETAWLGGSEFQTSYRHATAAPERPSETRQRSSSAAANRLQSISLLGALRTNCSTCRASWAAT